MKKDRENRFRYLDHKIDVAMTLITEIFDEMRLDPEIAAKVEKNLEQNEDFQKALKFIKEFNEENKKDPQEEGPLSDGQEAQL